MIDEAHTPDELSRKEIFWIERLDACNPRKGYNKQVRAGGYGIQKRIKNSLANIAFRIKYNQELQRKKHRKALARRKKKRNIR